MATYFEQVKIDLLGISIFFFVDAGKKIFHVENNP